MIDKVQHGALSFRQGVRSQQVVSGDFAQDWRGREVRRDHAQNRECGLVRVHLAKLTGRSTLFDRSHELIMKRAQVLPDDPIEIPRFLHGFALNQAGVIRMRRQKIEIAQDKGAKPLSRRTVSLRRRVDVAAELAENAFKHGPMQAAFVAEVVVKHRLVRVRRHSDFVCARARHSLSSKMLLGRGQDALRGRRVLNSLTSSRHCLLLAIRCRSLRI